MNFYHHSVCPYCLTESDTESLVVGDLDRPVPDDISLCSECGLFSVFDEQLQRRKPVGKETKAIRKDLMLSDIQAQWREFKERTDR